MLLIYRHITDPYLNIAAEEYFVKHAADDLCMLWINEPSVIIGKHQNAYAEINYPFVSQNNIPVIRRISGGGAVYHDTGNINFSFIKKSSGPAKVEFSLFTDIIRTFIGSYGLDITTNKRNSLFIGNLKFSGHAEHVFKNNILHHGTLLFNSNLDVLQKSLTTDKEYQSKAMPSERSEVGNLAPLLPQNIHTEQFINQFINWLTEGNSQNIEYNLSKSEIEAITELAETKYKTWKWNFGYSLPYSFQIDLKLPDQELSLRVKVVNGIIQSIESSGAITDDLFKKLEGIEHREETINNFLLNNKKELEHAGINTVSFYKSFF